MPQAYESLTKPRKAVVIGLGSGWSEIGLLERILDGETVSASEADANDNRVAALAALQLLAYIVTAILFIRWFHRAYRNLDALAAPRRHGIGWAIGGWFVPILGLWRPKQIANDIWWGSAPEGEAQRASGLLLVWWLGYIVTSVIANIAFRATLSGDETEDIQRADYAYLVSDFLDAVVGVLAILVVMRITERMEARATERPEPEPETRTEWAPPV
jgi:hypothetical protein